MNIPTLIPYAHYPPDVSQVSDMELRRNVRLPPTAQAAESVSKTAAQLRSYALEQARSRARQQLVDSGRRRDIQVEIAAAQAMDIETWGEF